MRRAAWIAGGIGALALPHDAARVALAAAAGTLFEAAPFVVLASFVPARLRGLASLGGCGCGGPGALPGALALPAAALCVAAFGPGVALARAISAAALAAGIRAFRRRARRHGHAAGAPPERPFDELAGIAACSAAVALAAPDVAHAAAGHPAAAAAAGLALGLLVPCATAGVAVAAGFAGHAPVLAAALLATAGVVPRPALPGRVRSAAPSANRDARFATAALAAALAALCCCGPSGLVNPRFLPVAAAGALAAAARACGGRPRAGRGALAVPAVMLAGLAAGSPAPAFTASDATIEAGYPGEAAAFTGRVIGGSAPGATRLVRFAIACCRLDASAVTVTLDRRLPAAAGAWVRASGRFAGGPGGCVLHVERWERIPPPRDPFVYR